MTLTEALEKKLPEVLQDHFQKLQKLRTKDGVFILNEEIFRSVIKSTLYDGGILATDLIVNRQQKLIDRMNRI